MVSFWPFKGDDSSPASFEKALSALSGKITKTNTKLDTLRQSSRRFNALWTLYTSFAYLLYTIILVLVIGWRQWGLGEYTAVVGGPVGIYAVRFAATTVYNYRIGTVQNQSDDLQKQRDATIEKLKTATKYNTTQELLKKYGGTPPAKPKPNGAAGSERKPSGSTPSSASKGGRTAFVPPPTANLPGRNGPISLPATPQQAVNRPRDMADRETPHSAAAAVGPWPQPSSPLEASAEFAPNAFSSAPQYASSGDGARWYDRVLDILLGEDETLPRSRLALICSKCRLVNGQAPPGIKQLEDVGTWRCAGCGTMNGKEDEAKRIIQDMRGQNEVRPRRLMSEADGEGSPVDVKEDDPRSQESGGEESDVTQYSDTASEESGEVQSKGKASGQQSQRGTPRRRSSRVRKNKGEEG
ncbi:MAG: hypothetical protein LQ351_004199 [Letrouitia transgressa]|nr:MAG: hypothetical protein LQ351_004199 [Letrouitia transgressa]